VSDASVIKPSGNSALRSVHWWIMKRRGSHWVIFSGASCPAHSVSRPVVVRGDQTWAFFSCFSLFCAIVFFAFLMHDYLCSINPGLLYIFVVGYFGFWFCFLTTSQGLAGKSISEMTYFCWVACKTLTQSLPFTALILFVGWREMQRVTNLPDEGGTLRLADV